MASPDSKRRLPPYVHVSGKSYWYREFRGRKDGRIQWGSRVRLCPIDAPTSAIWAAYEALGTEQVRNLRWLLSTYFSSRDFDELKPTTQKGYRSFAQALCEVKLRDGQVFGSTPLTHISSRVIQLYLDSYPARVAANRHIALIKLAWNHALCRFDNLPANPTTQVRLNREAPRTRYVSPDEFKAVATIAPHWLRLAMELAYICRARRSEVLALRVSDVLERGLMLRRSKGSRDEVTLFTPRLQAVVDECLALPGVSNYLIHTEKGKINHHQFSSAWSRVMAKAECERFTFHDLKAAGLSDMHNPNAGHKSEKMLAVYLRKPMEVSPDYHVTNSVTKK